MPDSTVDLIQVQYAYAESLYVLSQQMKSRLAPRSGRHPGFVWAPEPHPEGVQHRTARMCNPFRVGILFTGNPGLLPR